MKKIIVHFWILLLLLGSTAVYAKIDMVNVTMDPNRHIFYTESLTKLHASNPAFAVMYDELMNREKTYYVFLMDYRYRPILANTIKDDSKLGMINNFISADASKIVFDPKRLNSGDPSVKALMTKLHGHPVIVFEQIYKETPQGLEVRTTEDEIFFQEFFHAYQLDFYKEKDPNFDDYKNNPTNLKLIEVEGELATQIFGPKPLTVLDRGISKIQNLTLFHEYFTKDCNLTEQNKIEMSEVMEKIWKTLNSQGYVYNFEKPFKKLNNIDDFLALQALQENL